MIDPSRTRSLTETWPRGPYARALAALMREISERCYCAGWMSGLERFLWDALGQRAPVHYGQDEVTEQELGDLLVLSTACNGWVVWDGDTGVEEMIWVRRDVWAEECAR